MLSISDVMADRIRIIKAKREQEYFERVNLVARENIEPTHGAYGSNMGMGVQGYTLKGVPGIVYLKDEDVARAKARFKQAQLEGKLENADEQSF